MQSEELQGKNAHAWVYSICHRQDRWERALDVTRFVKHQVKNVKLLTILPWLILSGCLLAGCAETVAPSPNIFQRAQGKAPAPPPPNGFLGKDYSLLTPPSPADGSDQQAMLRYSNANIN
jgi:hypothetical protein